MAASLVSIDINELEKQRLGYIGISLTDWTLTTVSQYASGSKWEDAGSIYELTGNEDMGTAGEWAGIGDATLTFSYFNPSTLDFHWTTTAPTWDTAKQGWYGTGGSATYRYIASVYKSSGAYTQKTILISREKGDMYQGVNLGGNAANADHYLRFATDSSIQWDETNNKFSINNNSYIRTLLVSNTLHINNSNITQNDVFDALDSYIPITNDRIRLVGFATLSSTVYTFSSALRTNATTITLYYCNSSVAGTLTAVNGVGTQMFANVSLSW